MNFRRSYWTPESIVWAGPKETIARSGLQLGIGIPKTTIQNMFKGEDGGTVFIRNVGSHLASQPRRPPSTVQSLIHIQEVLDLNAGRGRLLWEKFSIFVSVLHIQYVKCQCHLLFKIPIRRRNSRCYRLISPMRLEVVGLFIRIIHETKE
jgi:hypothetical protein